MNRLIAFLLLLSSTIALAADIKISALPPIANSQLVGADSVPIYDSVTIATKSLNITEMDKRWAAYIYPVPTYANFAALPVGVSNGAMAITLDTATLYMYSSGASTWVKQLKNPASLTSEVTGVLPLANGGTNATSAATARTSLGAAASGANSDITSLSGLTTPLSIAQGGTNAGTASAARTALSAAQSGANGDITSLSALSTPLSVGQGGTGLASGTSGGVLGFTASGTLTSSGALAANGVVYGGGAGATPGSTAAGTTGQVLTAVTSGAPVWAPPATSGTVTSVAETVPSFLSISGSPITSSGTLALSYSGTALPVANGGTGLTAGTSGGIPAYTATGTLTSSGALTSNGVLYGGGAGFTPGATGAGTTDQVLKATSSAAPSWGSLNLASSSAVGTSILGAANGGTGVASLTLGSLQYGNGTSPLQPTGAPGQYNVLVGNGSNLPGWGQVNLAQSAAVTGVLPAANGGTGVNSTATFPSSGVVTTNAATQTLTNKTLTTPVQSSYEDFTEISAPAAPSAGVVRMYSKSGDGLYFQAPSGVETQIGTGSSGTGAKNYVSAGASTAAGWAASSGAITIGTNVTAAQIPEPTIGSALQVTGVSGSTAYAYFAFKLDPDDYNKLLSIQLNQMPQSGYVSNDFQISITSCTIAWSSGSCGGTSARLAMSTDVSAISGLPNFTGSYRTTFGSTNATAPYLQLAIGLNGTNAHSVTFSSITVGPGVVTQGAALGPTQSYTPVTQGLGTIASVLMNYQRQGDSVHVQGRFTTGTTTASQAQLGLPLNLTTNYGNTTVVGTWWLNTSTGTTVKTGVINTQGATSYVNFGYDDFTSSAGGPATAFNGSAIFGNSVVIWVDFTVTTNEWAGSGTVNVAQNDCQYSSNNSTNNANDTGSFAYGPSGSQFVNFSTADRLKTVNFISPIQSTDKISLETSSDSGVTWIEPNASPAFDYYHTQNSVSYGMGWQPSTATNIIVTFAPTRRNVSASWGGTGTDWSAVAATPSFVWRAKKCSGPATAGFSNYSPNISAGLIPASGVPGLLDNTAIASGNVGQIITSGSIGTGVTVTSSQTAVGSVSVTAGRWTLYATAVYSGASGNAYFDCNVNSISASLSGTTFGIDRGLGQIISASGVGSTISLVVPVTVGSGVTQPYYLNCATSTGSASSGGILGSIRAIRAG